MTVFRSKSVAYDAYECRDHTVSKESAMEDALSYAHPQCTVSIKTKSLRRVRDLVPKDDRKDDRERSTLVPNAHTLDDVKGVRDSKRV